MPATTAPAAHVDQLIWCLDHADPTVRQRALRLLVDIDDPRVTAALLARFPRYGSSVGVIQAITRHHDPALVDPLLQHLTDPDPRVREAASSALGDLHDQRAVPALVAQLDDPHPLVRGAACYAVATVLGLQAIPLLVPRLHDPHPRVREWAARALLTLRDPQAVAAVLRRWQDSPDENVNVRIQVRAALAAHAIPHDERWGWPEEDQTEPIQEPAVSDLAEVTREQLVQFISLVHTLLERLLENRMHAVRSLARPPTLRLSAAGEWKLGGRSGKRVRQQLKSLEARILHTERQWSAASTSLQPVRGEDGVRVFAHLRLMISILQTPADARLRQDELQTAVRAVQQFVAALAAQEGG